MVDFQAIIAEKKKKHQNQKKKPSSIEVKITREQRLKSIHRNLLSQFEVPKRFQNKTFKTYKVYPENKEGFEKVKEYVKTFKDRKKNGDWLVLAGGYGLGKTHLALAAGRKSLIYFAKKILDDNPHALNYVNAAKCPVLFMTITELIEEIRNSYDSDRINEQEIMVDFKNRQLLIIDDLGSEKASEWQKEKLYSILDYRYRELLPTIITTNLDTAELNEHVSKRVVDRMLEAAGDYLWEFRGESYRRKGLKKQ